MKNKIIILFTMLFFGIAGMGQQSSDKGLKIVDSLTPAERKLQNRIVLQSEVDSMIADYMKSLPKQQADQAVPIVEAKTSTPLPVILSSVIILMLGAFMIYYYRQQKKLTALTRGVEKNGVKENKKSRLSSQDLESRVSELKNELLSLSKENENLNRVIKEYNGIQHDYDSLKHGMLQAFKVRNYPGYDKSRKEMVAMQGVFNTERSVSAYAFEKFLKPILAIADANKNSPARTPAADKEKIVDLLVSLSLLYIEYLYLRVNELSIGGKIIQRIQGFEHGNGIDQSLLKKLDTEFGSRALVIKLALKNAGVNHLNYPVFDETNLNN